MPGTGSRIERRREATRDDEVLQDRRPLKVVNNSYQAAHFRILYNSILLIRMDEKHVASTRSMCALVGKVTLVEPADDSTSESRNRQTSRKDTSSPIPNHKADTQMAFKAIYKVAPRGPK